mmetsp:Transcript_86448/g.231609  ORF Transcript_86448/g.231609 Transcript_86448/m.231609 type:complete len:343 (-) Transcript_86448:1895-2923(-)
MNNWLRPFAKRIRRKSRAIRNKRNAEKTGPSWTPPRSWKSRPTSVATTHTKSKTFQLSLKYCCRITYSFRPASTLKIIAKTMFAVSTEAAYPSERTGKTGIAMATVFKTMQHMMMDSNVEEATIMYILRLPRGSRCKLYTGKYCRREKNVRWQATHLAWLSVVRNSEFPFCFSELKLSMMTPMQRFKTKKLPMKMNETKKRARHSLKSRSPRSIGPLASTPAYMTSTHISVVAISKHVMMAVPMASKFWLLFTHRPPCSTHIPASRMNRSQNGHSQPARHSALQTVHSSDTGSEHASGQENKGSSSQSTVHCCTFSADTAGQNSSRHVVHCITLYPQTCDVS